MTTVERLPCLAASSHHDVVETGVGTARCDSTGHPNVTRQPVSLDSQCHSNRQCHSTASVIRQALRVAAKDHRVWVCTRGGRWVAAPTPNPSVSAGRQWFAAVGSPGGRVLIDHIFACAEHVPTIKTSAFAARQQGVNKACRCGIRSPRQLERLRPGSPQLIREQVCGCDQLRFLRGVVQGERRRRPD